MDASYALVHQACAISCGNLGKFFVIIADGICGDQNTQVCNVSRLALDILTCSQAKGAQVLLNAQFRFDDLTLTSSAEMVQSSRSLLMLPACAGHHLLSGNPAERHM